MAREVTLDEERFWSKVDRPAREACWLWTRATNGRYGQVRWNERQRGAHRVAYELAYGPIPEGHVIDHLCNVPLCCNPRHLEAVQPWVNAARSGHDDLATHCGKGHPLSGKNLYVPARGGRQCRTCRHDAVKRFRARRRNV